MTNNDRISRTELLKEITLAETASRTAYPKMNFTKRDIVALIKDAKAKDAEPQDGCEYCHPDENGEYTMQEFENPQNPRQRATVSFYGGMLVVELELFAAAMPSRLSCEIKFCPMCGRKFEGKY